MRNAVNTRMYEPMISGFRLTRVLFTRCLVRNQLENARNLKCPYYLIQPDVPNPLVLICGRSLFFIYVGS